MSSIILEVVWFFIKNLFKLIKFIIVSLFGLITKLKFKKDKAPASAMQNEIAMQNDTAVRKQAVPIKTSQNTVVTKNRNKPVIKRRR